METFLIKAAQLILALSFLVVIHELGHFLFARLFKVRVEKFYMFFNPWRSIVRAKRFNGKWHIRFFARNVESNLVPRTDSFGNEMKDEKGKPLYRPMTEAELQALPEDDWRRYPDNTEWGLGWLPLGGYCSIAGMVDETKAAGDLPSEPQPWEYRAKKTWQRLPIIVGGVLVNFVAALLIYGMILFTWGTEYMPIENATYGFQFSPVMVDAGFEQGDKILTINGKTPQDKSDVVEWLLVEGDREVVVERQVKERDSLGNYQLSIINYQLEMPEDLGQQALASGNTALIDFRYPFVVDSVIPGTPAAQAQLQRGDSIVAVNDVPTSANQDVTAELQKHACDSVSITYYRQNETSQPIAHSSTLYLGDEAKIGVYTVSRYNYLHTKRIEYGFFESIPAGCKFGWETLVSYVKQFKLVFTKEGAQSIGGFGAIGSLFPPVWDWHLFWLMTAFLSIILAFMNIIPIPGLDGGHMLFLLWEMITGKKPSDKFLEIVGNIGFWLLIALFLYANLNDIFRLF